MENKYDSFLNLDKMNNGNILNSLNTKKEKVLILETNNLPKYNKKKPRNTMLEYISVAKILASFSVVMLHTNGVFWIFNYENYKTYWISANIIESIFYFAVPFFVLCIGATLLDFNEKYGIKKYYYKRIKKVVLPLIYWNIILYIFKVYIIKDMNKEKINIIYLWNLYYNHKIYSIFGSFHTFLLSYMMIPLLAYVEKAKKIKVYSYCFITLLITQALFPYLISLFEPRLIWIYNIKIGYIIYIFAGYIIENYRFEMKWKLIIYLLGISSLLVHIFGTKILTLRYKRIIGLHKGYLNLPCIIYSCSLFLLLKEYNYLLLKIINRKIINKIGTLTIGPFFMHLPIIDIYKKYFKVNSFSLKYRLFGGFFIYFICLIITFILKKIPLIKYIVP